MPCAALHRRNVRCDEYGIDLNRVKEVGETTSVFVNPKPTGEHYMQDLYAAELRHRRKACCSGDATSA
jgi:hypothetical protein